MKVDKETFNEGNSFENAFDIFCQILSSLVDLKEFLVALLNSDRDAMAIALDDLLEKFDMEVDESECAK